MTTTDFEERGDLLGKNSFSGHARVPLRIDLAGFPAYAGSAEHLLFAVWKMFLQPMLEQRRNRPWQADNCVTGKLRARFCARFQDLRNFVIGESRNDRRDHYANRNSCVREVARWLPADACGDDVRGSSTRCNVGSRDVTETFTAAALHAASSRKISMSRVTRWFFVMIATGLRNFASTSRQPRVMLQFSLDRLIRIGHAAHHERLRLPSRRLQFGAQQLRRIGFHHDLAFEIEAGGKPEIFVGRPRITINAAVLAAAIRIQARFKANIRTVIAGDDRSRSVAKILRRAPRLSLRSRRIDIDDVDVGQIDMQFFESICRAPGRATPANGGVALRRFHDYRTEFLFRRHRISSHEHIPMSSKSFNCSCYTATQRDFTDH